MIHATIDDYSRLPLYCHCSNTNRAETVLFLFEIHMDYLQQLDVIREEKMSKLHIICLVIHSGVQVEVALSVDAASTTNASNGFGEMYLHFTGCTSLFYHLFYHLEDSGILNCDDPIHLWCLHLIYIPYNLSLTTFVDGWENHPMSSVRGLSPRQLIMGARNVR